jgi:hypothetical protein
MGRAGASSNNATTTGKAGAAKRGLLLGGREGRSEQAASKGRPRHARTPTTPSPPTSHLPQRMKDGNAVVGPCSSSPKS